MKYLVSVIILTVSITFAFVPEEETNDEIRVLVIDTGIGQHAALKGYVQYDDSEDYEDNNGHGTHVTGIILYGNKMRYNPDPLCKRVKIYSCKYYYGEKRTDTSILTQECIRRAINKKMHYINYSAGGTEFNPVEYKLYREFSRNGGVSVFAAGNDSKDLREHSYYPALYSIGIKNKFNAIPNTYMVQNIDRNGEPAKTTNTHPEAISAVGENVYSTVPNNKYGYISGTSQATPQVLHMLLKKKCEEL